MSPIIHVGASAAKVCPSCGYIWSQYGCEPDYCRAPCHHAARELRGDVVVCLGCGEKLPRIYAERNGGHRNMGPPEYYPCCGGRGWFATEDGERYCSCDAGAERKRVD